MPDNSNTFPILQADSLLLYEKKFSLSFVGLPHRSVVVEKEEKKLPSRQLAHFYSHGKFTPQQDVDCLWRSQFVQNNSVW